MAYATVTWPFISRGCSQSRSWASFWFSCWLKISRFRVAEIFSKQCCDVGLVCYSKAHHYIRVDTLMTVIWGDCNLRSGLLINDGINGVTPNRVRVVHHQHDDQGNKLAQQSGAITQLVAVDLAVPCRTAVDQLIA